MPNATFKSILPGLGLGGLSLLLLGVLFYLPSQLATVPLTRVEVWQFAQYDVTVDVALVTTAAGATQVVGTFTPMRAGFHLYSKDLPKAGEAGLGRPTLLEILTAEGVQVVGPLAADQPAHTLDFEGLPVSLPVYPAGPVTLRLPIVFSNPDQALIEISLTYMACSASTCLPPVVDARQWVTLPAPSQGTLR